MQDATSNFVRAATGAGRVRTDRLMIDWSADGASHNEVAELFGTNVTAGWGSAVLTTGVGPDQVVTTTPWSTHGDGGTVQASDYDVTGGAGIHEVPIAVAYRMTYLGSVDFGDMEVEVNFTCLAPSGGGLEPANLILRGSGTTTYLMARILIAPGGAVTLSLIELIDSVETSFGTATITHLTHSASTPLTVLAQWYGTDVRMRIWETGSREPIERWDLQASYLSNLPSGWVGVRSGVAIGNLNAKPVAFTYHSVRVTNGRYDDMSKRVGGWTVEHHLDDGLPDEVSFVAGTAVPTMRAELMRPGWVEGRGRLTNREFFSPFNDNSPIHSIERDVPPTTMEAGVVTEDGPQRLPVFTGRLQNLRMRGGEVALEASSATRLKLAKLVQPPAVYGYYEGANATWLVSYALAACGVYASPPPQDGCRIWMPMHGSVHPFLPATNPPQINTVIVRSINGDLNLGRQQVVNEKWVDGPFVSAPNFREEDGEVVCSMDNIATGDGLAMEAGADLYSQAGSLAKIEMWIRCDPNVSTDSLVRFFLVNTNDTFIDVGISGTQRALFISTDDGTTNDSFFHSTFLPDDGEWRFIGFAWDIANSKRWINLDGDVESDTTSFVTSGLPANDDFNDIDPRLRVRTPIAEVQVTSGPTANPDNFPWLLDIPFTPGAQIVRSRANLASIAERAPRQAWDILTSMALADLATLRIDENDVVQYMSYPHWGRAAQQSIVDVLDTSRNASALDVNIDPTKIRNSAAVTFSEGFNVNNFDSALAVSDVYQIDPGTTLLTLPTTDLIAEIRGFGFTFIADADTTQPTTLNFISLNTTNDGSGAYATSAQVTVEVLEWTPGSVTILFTNSQPITWFTANDKGWATINVAGKLLVTRQSTVVETDEASIAIRGEQGISVSMLALQRSYDARRVARRLVNSLAKPVPTVERTSVRGDPRRQPGDLVHVVDRETGIDNSFRLQSVYHDDDGELYSQQVTLRQAKLGGHWGDGVSRWGLNIWTSED